MTDDPYMDEFKRGIESARGVMLDDRTLAAIKNSDDDVAWWHGFLSGIAGALHGSLGDKQSLAVALIGLMAMTAEALDQRHGEPGDKPTGRVH